MQRALKTSLQYRCRARVKKPFRNRECQWMNTKAWWKGLWNYFSCRSQDNNSIVTRHGNGGFSSSVILKARQCYCQTPRFNVWCAMFEIQLWNSLVTATHLRP
jgi:hypothetical protein